MKIKLEFKLADAWIGAFWARKDNVLHVWICLLPCLPIHVQIPCKEAQ